MSVPVFDYLAENMYKRYYSQTFGRQNSGFETINIFPQNFYCHQILYMYLLKNLDFQIK